MSVSFIPEKNVPKSASSPATKVPNFCSKEVYFIQISFSAFTLLLKSETKNIFSGIGFFFFFFFNFLVVSKNVSFRGLAG